MAEAVIANNKICFIPEMKAFGVEGTRGDKYIVSLFPQEKCACPATTTCYHIMAARKQVGLKIEAPKKSVSLSQLATNSRKKTDKKSGRKRPRKND